ncbi:MAG: hypothetical protein SVT56_12565, partial [Chloroflexota bacterium]|nr:hypothetical protein [Chloroflexota bacterium]
PLGKPTTEANDNDLENCKNGRKSLPDQLALSIFKTLTYFSALFSSFGKGVKSPYKVDGTTSWVQKTASQP